MSPSPPPSESVSDPPLPFREAAMIPQQGDSAALAKRLLPSGTRISLNFGGDTNSAHPEKIVTLSSPCLEGHRFAVAALSPGDKVLSWGLPFGTALAPGIKPGDVLVNAAMSKALSGRLSGHHGEENTAIRRLLESQPVNFEDEDVSPDHPFDVDSCDLGVAGTNAPEEEGGTFPGYRRSGKRGVGTRNHVAVIGLTSSASPALLPLSDRWKGLEVVQDEDPMEMDEAAVEEKKESNKKLREDFDGVRIVAHTEGESPGTSQHNMAHIHRCVAGFLVHPNVGAAVLVTTGRERHVSKETLMEFVTKANAEAKKSGKGVVYPLECFEPPHCQWVQIRGGPLAASRKLDGAVEKAAKHAADGATRTPCPLRELSIALQCGGSDAFSGLTGNPLAGAMAKHFIFTHGSRAVLAESPELVGAEPYILSRVASERTARDFIGTTEHYKGYAARHGQSAAGNPSGGNLYRGLYNIVLKSLGAARKKAPEVALDRVLAYGEPMPSCPPARAGEPEKEGPHYAFMDSPGNDLESIAGQVSTGCNLILFITGNGAMTNFPFVPTLKIVTTSRRHKLLEHEMDINAGPFGHGGQDREKAVADAVSLAERVAGGERTLGEEAGHSQVNLWRNWAVDEGQEGGGGGEEKKTEDGGEGVPPEEIGPLRLCSDEAPHVVLPHPSDLPQEMLSEGPIRRAPISEGKPPPSTPLRPWALGSTYSIIPTSLCSSAISTTIRDSLVSTTSRPDLPRLACPSHSEGCGASGDLPYERTLQRLLLGHALHPSVSRALFLEHGCEKTHNDYFRNSIRECGALGEDSAADPEESFDFWSLQADGGFDNAKRHVAEYFLAEKAPAKDSGTATARPVFGVSWSDRPVSVGFMVDPSALGVQEKAEGNNGARLASALASTVRYMSGLGVHSVLPANSPLLTMDITVDAAPAQRPAEPASSSGDIEDLISPKASCASSTVPPGPKGPPPKRRRTDGTARAAFLADVLGSSNDKAEEGPAATLLPAQMIGASFKGSQGGGGGGGSDRGGLHVMGMPRKGGATWDETVSCLGPACDVIVVVGSSEAEAEALPGSGLAPTLRIAAPQETSDGGDGTWTDWIANVCRKTVEVLKSPIVSGGENGAVEAVKRLREELFTVTTFIVPRGNAVSL